MQQNSACSLYIYYDGIYNCHIISCLIDDNDHFQFRPIVIDRWLTIIDRSFIMAKATLLKLTMKQVLETPQLFKKMWLEK